MGILLQVLDAEFHRACTDDPKGPAVAVGRHDDSAGFHSGELIALGRGNHSSLMIDQHDSMAFRSSCAMRCLPGRHRQRGS
jgi:hypothetical protein